MSEQGSSPKTSRLLGWLADFVSARPRLVLVVTLVLAAAAATQVPFLEVTTSRTNLGHALSESERLFGEFLEEFGSPNDMIAVIDGAPGDELRRTADELAEALEKDKAHVRSTFRKMDIEFFLKRLLLFLPANEVAQIKGILKSRYADDVRQGKIDGLDRIVSEATDVFRNRPATVMDPSRVASGIETLRTIMLEMDRRLKDPSRRGLEGLRDLVPPLRAGAIDDRGYLQSRDGQIRVMFVRPASQSDENSVVLPLVESVRKTAAEVAGRHPGVQIRFTGLPALQADETKIVDRDVFATTVISLVLIAGILLFGYRKPQQVLLSLVPLAVGILWTMAITRLVYGRVNLVASAFMPILLGRGSDFAIYIIARYNAARSSGHAARKAVREALEDAGGGIVTGALVTSAAFLVATLGKLGVFRQLGVVVGLGLVFILIASLLITPALLILLGDRRMPGEEQAERALDKVPEFGAGPGGLSLRFPRTILGISAAAVLVLGFYAQGVPFDFDLLRFLPPGAESVTAQRDLTARSNYGTNAVVIAAPDVDSARRMAAELSAKPNVGRVESVAMFLPDDQANKLAAIATLREDVESIPPFTLPQPPTAPGRLGKALQDLGDVIDDTVFTADGAAKTNEKLAPVVASLKQFNEAVGATAKTVGSLDSVEAVSHIGAIESDVFKLLSDARQLLRDNVLDAHPLAVPDLPAATRERFFGKNGKSAVYVFPKKPGSGAELDEFVKDVRSVAPNATGFPVIYCDSSRPIKKGFYNSSGLAALVIVIALLVHFRRVGDALLALIPLSIGAVAMLGLMRLFSMENNVANITALPLLLGLGTDYGLQLVHHYRTVPDESLPEVLRKTGLGVFMAGGTTAAGFGALALSVHLGGRSLGLVLFMGTTAALFCSLVVLPAVLVLVERRWPRRKAVKAEGGMSAIG